MENIEIKEIRQSLFSLSEEKYKEFSSSLLPNVDNIMGVRIPTLRKIAKYIAKSNFYEYKSYCDSCKDLYFEEIMILGMTIGYFKCETEERFKLISDFVPLIDNWSVCDSFCATQKISRGEEDKYFEFVTSYITSNSEFEARFAIAMLLDHFINDCFIDRVFLVLNNVICKAYYCEMAVAWAVSICFSKFPSKTENFLKKNEISYFAFKKSVQKICELKGTTNSQKEMVKSLKKL